jgi:hypothetical protein
MHALRLAVVVLVVLIAISFVVRLPGVATATVTLLAVGIPAIWIPLAVRKKRREDFLHHARALAHLEPLTPESVDAVVRLRERLEPLSHEMQEEIDLILQELAADEGIGPKDPARQAAMVRALRGPPPR